MKRFLPILLVMLSVPALAGAQQAPVEWDPARLHVTRAELTDLLERLDAAAASTGYSGGLRQDARRSAERVRARLENGDFYVGDRIALNIEGLSPTAAGQLPIPDTLIVENGPAINVPNIGRIPLRGVLRSELQEHLQNEISRYIRNPTVRASSMIRISILGNVGNQGFHVFPSDMLLSEAIMQVGGPGQRTDWDDVTIQRANERLYGPDQVEEALRIGRSLDQLGLQAGDVIDVPVDEPSRIWPTVFRWSAIIVSTTLLGVRIF
jgi:protein involved in polysaccharide export with SLBB domain